MFLGLYLAAWEMGITGVNIAVVQGIQIADVIRIVNRSFENCSILMVATGSEK